MYEYKEIHKVIEDIIDANKESGKYDVLLNHLRPQQGQSVNTRYAYSAPNTLTGDLKDDVVFNVEGDNNNDMSFLDHMNSVGPTDSEITLVRVKREGSQYRTQVNNWDMHDKAIPGDGTHLGESPSMVNLVTLMIPSKHSFKSKDMESFEQEQDQQEYMVPLSSWEPVHSSAETEPANENTEPDENAPETSTRNEEVIKTSEDVTSIKSTSSFKELFRCFMFWRHNLPQENDAESVGSGA